MALNYNFVRRAVPRDVDDQQQQQQQQKHV